jgi:hemoglobin-like flavoprotein
MPDRVFVAYSHKDEVWRQWLKEELGSVIYAKDFELWIDESIDAGASWQAAINAAISSSRIALFLVSDSFLKSDFIVKDELRKFLERHRVGAVTIFWIPVEVVSDFHLERVGLKPIQAVWSSKVPLCKMDADARKKALTEIGQKLIHELSIEPWGSLKKKVAETLGGVNVILGKAFDEGDYSVFYKGTQAGADVAIKALVPAPGRDWLSKDFVQRAKVVREIENSTAITIKDVVEDVHTPCVVMKFVHAPTLKKLLEDKKKLEPGFVAKIIAQLVHVAFKLHRLQGQPVLGPVRPSHVHYDEAIDQAFISLIPIASETLESCREKPTRLLDSNGLSYLSPERYYGRAIDGRVDQYYLGLLALELLQGRPPVQVKNFSDLELKTDFFKAPRKYFGKDFRLSQPGFSFVLARMLEPEPGKRWAKTSELVSALEEVATGKVPSAVKEHAGAQYDGALRKNKDFFRSFYRILFEKSPEIRALFCSRARTDEEFAQLAERQSDKLNKAMANILNFTRNRYATSLRDDADRHRDMGIKAKYFGPFRDAFLETLVEAKITDEYSQDAWRAILDPALAYMRDQIKSKPG